MENSTRNQAPPDAQASYQVSQADLPLYCPVRGSSLWNLHPRVFLPIEETGFAKCPYCGAEFTLQHDS